MSARGAKALFVVIVPYPSGASAGRRSLLLPLVGRERSVIRFIQGLLRRCLSGEDRADGDLELFGHRGVDGDAGTSPAVLEHVAELVVDRRVEPVYGVKELRVG